MSAVAFGRRSVRAVTTVGRRLRNIPPGERMMSMWALVVLAVVEVLVRVTTIPRASRVLGVRLDLQPVGVKRTPTSIAELPIPAQRALRCTERVTRLWPFCSGPCLRRALVGGFLIRRLDPAVRIGLAPDEGLVRAHAWLEVDGAPLEDVDEFTAFESSVEQRAEAS